MGDNSVYGNILIDGDDDIVVGGGGETEFDGEINPEGMREGTLTVDADSALYLRDNDDPANDAYSGPSNVWIDDLDINGGLALELPNDTTGSTQAVPEPAGSYSQLFANTVDIAGATLEIRPSTTNGLYADEYYFDNVIDADVAQRHLRQR